MFTGEINNEEQDNESIKEELGNNNKINTPNNNNNNNNNNNKDQAKIRENNPEINKNSKKQPINEVNHVRLNNKNDYRNTIGTSDLRRIRDQTLRERGGKPKKQSTSRPLDFKIIHAKAANFPGSLVHYPEKKDSYYSGRTTKKTRVFRSWSECVNIWMDWGQLKTWLLYKEALIEFVGTMLLVFCALSIIITMSNYFTFSVDYNPLNQIQLPFDNFVTTWRAPVSIGLLHTFMIALLILSCAPASGAHLNPTITITTLLSGYTPLSKGLVYMIAQFTGGIVGAGLVRGIIPDVILNRTQLAVCSFGSDFNTGRALCAEFILTFINIFVSFTTALDPRQYEVLGPIVSAFLISGTVGLTQILAGGYAYFINGPGYNMARCLGPAIIHGYWKDLWVFFVAEFLAAIFMAIILLINPPFKTISTYKSYKESPSSSSEDDFWEEGPNNTRIRVHRRKNIQETEWV